MDLDRSHTWPDIHLEINPKRDFTRCLWWLRSQELYSPLSSMDLLESSFHLTTSLSKKGDLNLTKWEGGGDRDNPIPVWFALYKTGVMRSLSLYVECSYIRQIKGGYVLLKKGDRELVVQKRPQWQQHQENELWFDIRLIYTPFSQWIRCKVQDIKAMQATWHLYGIVNYDWHYINIWQQEIIHSESDIWKLLG